MTNLRSFVDELNEHGKVLHTNKGRSMWPLIKEGRDVMVIEKRPEGRLKKYDIPLYTRGDDYIVHRILKVREDDYVICGDHNAKKEYGIRDEQILGVLTVVIRDGKREIRVDSLGQKIYAHLWCDFFYIRIFILKCSGLLHRIYRFAKRGFKRSGK